MKYNGFKIGQGLSAALLVLQTAQKPWTAETYVYAALVGLIAWLSPSTIGITRKKKPTKE